MPSTYLICFRHSTQSVCSCRALQNGSIDVWEEPSCPAGERIYNLERSYTKRTEFSTSSCSVFGWPSSGGVLIEDEIDAVGLDFLGLDRFKATERSSSPAEEDAFCTRLRKIGAKWWEYQDDFYGVSLGYGPTTPEEEQDLVFEWPEQGGVWLLVFENARAWPRDFGRIHMAHNMEERCRIIEEYGGTFYADPGDCPSLQDQPQWTCDNASTTDYQV